MSYDFCLGCGALLPPYNSVCKVCGFDNSPDQDQDISDNDDDFMDSAAGSDYEDEDDDFE